MYYIKNGRIILIIIALTGLLACTAENKPNNDVATKPVTYQPATIENTDSRHHMTSVTPGTGLGLGIGTGTLPTTPPVGGLPFTPPATLPVTPPATLPVTPPVATPNPITTPPVTPTPVTPPTPAPVTPTPVTPAPVTPTPVAPSPAAPGPVLPAALPGFQYLPVLTDTDGNPDDNAATYNLSVDANVPVNVVTPNGSWTTPMMRYNSSQLPPVIVAKRGMQMTFKVTNNLVEDTTVHWHGFKIPAIQDGGPEFPIVPNETQVYSFKLQQPAAPLWFHPHAHGTTATQVYNGLAGALVVTDDITLQLETNKQLPSGAFDIPLLIQDRSFTADLGTGARALAYQPNMMGMLGDTVLVNGVQMPALDVETRQYRFKLFNGSNARTYDFALANNATFKVIGTDGGLLAAPFDTDHILLSAGERAEIVINFAAYNPGDSVTLVNRASAATSSTFNIMQFDIATTATDDVTLYTALPGNAEIYDRLTLGDAIVDRSFVMSMGGMGPGGMQFVINGKTFDMNRVDEVVAKGTTEIWTISNTSMMAHPFHAHAIQWQVLDRNNLPPTGTDLGWKDTVLVQPGETVRFIGHFDPVINIGKYMYHCHILEHEEAGMMGIFEIQ